MLRNAARGAGLTAVAGGAYLYATDEGTRRSTQFWREVFPIYVSYRFNQWRIENAAARTLLGELSSAEQKESWEALWLRNNSTSSSSTCTTVLIVHAVNTWLVPGQWRRVTDHGAGHTANPLWLRPAGATIVPSFCQ